MERSYFELYNKFNESLYFWSSLKKQIKKKQLILLEHVGNRELYQIQISGKTKNQLGSCTMKDMEVNISFTTYGNCQHKIYSFSD